MLFIACTAWMLMESNCPRHSVNCLCDQRPCLAGLEQNGMLLHQSPYLPTCKERPMKGCLRRRNQATLHVLYASQCDL